MTWRDNLRPASFRSVPFEVFSADRDGIGRKIDEHEFPGRDYTQTEDFGRSARVYRFEAVIIGPDYMAARDAFDAALETPGPGILIHPWYGRKSVVLRVPASTTESTEEGGMIRYSLEFIEAEADKTATVAQVDKKAEVVTASEALKTQASSDFLSKFKASGFPDFVKTGAGGTITKLSDQFDGLTAGLKGSGDTLNGYIADGLKLRSGVLDLVLKPASLLSSISRMIGGIRLIAATPKDATAALKTLMRFGTDLKPVIGTTPSRRAERANQAALAAVVQQLAVAEVVRAVSATEFVAYQDAAATRDEMATLIDDLAVTAADAGDDGAYRSLQTARAASIADVTARGGSLQRLYDYVPPVSTSALVLAYNLYEDSSLIEERAADLIVRNAIAHPGFITCGRKLEVLSDG